MASNDKTVFDSGATVREGSETVFESSAVALEGGTTMLEAVLSDAAGQVEIAAKENIAIQKGATILDTYRVETDAIEGGMGSVWRVHHMGWNVDLAMKRPQPQCFSDEKSKADFIRECEAWINLGLHPNIVSCYYVREIGDTPSIFSEWMEGGSLESAIRKGTLYEGAEAEQWERLLDITIQFARGLHYAHEEGLIHQDVKPDNVLLTKEGEAKVADFGLARARAMLTVIEGDPTMRENADGGKAVFSPSGGYTPAYCSMEQMDGKPLTRRTDIYSWAVSVMEMYLGYCPWANGVVAGLNCRKYFEQTRVSMPEALKELLVQCLDSEPENRPHDFAEAEAKLHEIYAAETGGTYPRPVPKAAADTADSLNNRALSFLDLGKPEEAKMCWERALRLDSKQMDVIFNQTLFAWRQGQITDLQALERIKGLHGLVTDEEEESCIDALLRESGNADAQPMFPSTPPMRIPVQSKATCACLCGDEMLFACVGYRDQELVRVRLEDGGVERDDCQAVCEKSAAGIRSMAISGDGKIILFSMYGGGLYVYDAERRCILWELECKESLLVQTLKLSRNGTTAVVVTSRDKSDRLWIYNTQTGKLIKCVRLTQTTAAHHAASFAGDDTALYYKTAEKERISALNVTTGKEYIYTSAKATGRKSPLYHSAIVSKGRYHVFTTDADHDIAYHHPQTGEILSIIRNNLLWAEQKLAVDTPYIYANTDKNVYVYNMESGSCVRSVPINIQGNLIVDIASRRTISWSCSDTEIMVNSGLFIEPPSPKSASSWRLCRIAGTAQRLSAEKRLAKLEERFFEAYRTGAIERALPIYEEAREVDAFIGTAAHRRMELALRKVCKIRSLRNTSKLWEIECAHTAIGFSDEASRLYGLNKKNGGVSVYDCESGKKLRTAQIEEGEYLDVIHPVPNGFCLFNTELAMWKYRVDEASEIELVARTDPREGGKLYAVNHDGRFMIVKNGKTSDESTSFRVLLIDNQEGKEKILHYSWNNFAEFNYACFLPDERRAMVSRPPDSSYPAVMDFEGGGLQAVEGLGDRACYGFYNQHKCCISPDGTRMALFFNPVCELQGRRSIAVLDLELEQQLLELRVNDSDCVCLKFSPNGRFLLAAMKTHYPKLNLQLIDVDEKTERPVDWTNMRIDAADFSPDGRFIAALKYNWETKEQTLACYWLDCDYSFPGFADWDEGARLYLDIFRALYSHWTNADFEKLVVDLQNRGYGWLRPKGVRAKLEEIAAADKPSKRTFSLFGKNK